MRLVGLGKASRWEMVARAGGPLHDEGTVQKVRPVPPIKMHAVVDRVEMGKELGKRVRY
jgi:hypothetical protein